MFSAAMSLKAVVGELVIKLWVSFVHARRSSRIGARGVKTFRPPTFDVECFVDDGKTYRQIHARVQDHKQLFFRKSGR